MKAYFEPAGDDVDRYTTLRIVVDTGDLFRCYGRVPWAWEECRDYIELFGKMQQSLGERDGFMLIVLRYTLDRA